MLNQEIFKFHSDLIFKIKKMILKVYTNCKANKTTTQNTIKCFSSFSFVWIVELQWTMQQCHHLVEFPFSSVQTSLNENFFFYKQIFDECNTYFAWIWKIRFVFSVAYLLLLTLATSPKTMNLILWFHIFSHLKSPDDAPQCHC